MNIPCKTRRALQCGTGWQRNYTRMHAAMLRGEVEPRYLAAIGENGLAGACNRESVATCRGGRVGMLQEFGAIWRHNCLADAEASASWAGAAWRTILVRCQPLFTGSVPVLGVGLGAQQTGCRYQSPIKNFLHRQSVMALS